MQLKEEAHSQDVKGPGLHCDNLHNYIVLLPVSTDTATGSFRLIVIAEYMAAEALAVGRV